MSNEKKQQSPPPPTSVWEELAQISAAKYGMDPHEASLWMRAIQEKEKITFMDEIAQNASVIKQFAPGMQRDVLGMYAMQAVQPKDSVKELKDMALQMTVLRESLRGDSDGKPDEATQGKIAELQKTLKEMKEAESKRQPDQIQTEFKERMEKMEKSLTDKLAAMTLGPPQTKGRSERNARFHTGLWHSNPSGPG